VTVAAVNLWGRRIGAVSVDGSDGPAVFQFDPDFAARGNVEVAPLQMPRRADPYQFPALSRETFGGLPGMLADSLPDRFGTALIDAWLAIQGREPESFDIVERLCYVGTRGIGALEFAPAIGPERESDEDIDVAALVELASEVLTARTDLKGSFETDERREALQQILSVGTSAGGARAKAVIAWNPETNVVRSGQVDAGPGFDHWLLKFDGVSGNKDKELEDPLGYGVIEFAYSMMAQAAGIDMSKCRLLDEGDRRHFMTRRFDRRANQKLHMQSLGAIAHFDFNQARAYSYEQALQTIRRLGLSMDAVEQQFRRMTFNVVARNQDDHVKNIAFLMDRSGDWSLSPAFDVTYSYARSGAWTNRHQMTVNGKSDAFSVDDFDACAEVVSMKKGRGRAILHEVQDTVRNWAGWAEKAGVPDETTDRIAAAHRLSFD
jgi:serine/threonine-protein kinase HipA